MPTGRVKWFNNAKGYGFILPDEGGDDLFAHYSSIVMEGYKTLKAGQPVVYEVLSGPKGSHAINISCIDEDGAGDSVEESAGDDVEVNNEDSMDDTSQTEDDI
jgi:CspA family cold shock protein